MIYDKIKEICKKKNMSIRSVEIQADLGNGSICKWNDSSPTIANLKAVASVLGVKLEDLI